MSPQFRVTLTKEEVEELQKISSTGSRSAKIVLFARALLLLDKGSHTAEHWTVNQTSKAVGLSERTLNHLKEKFVSQGLDSIIRPRADFSQVCERSSQWCELRYSQVQTAH